MGYVNLELSPERRKQLIDRIANEIVKRGLETPAIMFLETIKPLSFIGAEMAIFYLFPYIKAITTSQIVDEITAIFHDRSAVEELIKRIEELVEIEKEKERAAKEAKKKMKQMMSANEKKKKFWIFGD
ncbi:MAG: hypothetical protein NZ926_00320 [Candidatus Methanomethylicia archaeon]|nr:hypothetical protein [Candidatus Methanomethylicia archaeon]MCX8168880.1 hypothetical protein [Candidatus Methanomethylicia archaeon]MDW7988612.1 hypothetical protein [Nitrososphaerota archaeon]